MAINIPKVKPINTVQEELLDKVLRPSEGNFIRNKLDIDTYRSKFLNGSARSYLFLCTLQFPGMQNALKNGISGALSEPKPDDISKMVDAGLIAGGVSAINTGGIDKGTTDFKYYVRSTSLPSTELEETSTYFCGNQYKIPTVRRYQDWTVQLYIDNNAKILRKFWEWSQLIQNPETGIYGNTKDFMTDQTIQLLGLDGSVICTYVLYHSWLKTIGQVDLDYSSNELAVVDITFTYQYHTISVSKESDLSKTSRQMLNTFASTKLTK
jgi:hypothetical protein